MTCQGATGALPKVLVQRLMLQTNLPTLTLSPGDGLGILKDLC